ncbi:MAG: aspartate carbamoyltransferase regulatory subunit, partial [Prevotella sp.]
MAKKELLVTAIENGTVIDHIPADKTDDVANLL